MEYRGGIWMVYRAPQDCHNTSISCGLHATLQLIHLLFQYEYIYLHKYIHVQIQIQIQILSQYLHLLQLARYSATDTPAMVIHLLF